MAAGVLLNAERLALDHVLVPHLARHLGKDRDRMRIPLHALISWN
jgi:hypothetical protein